MCVCIFFLNWQMYLPKWTLWFLGMDNLIFRKRQSFLFKHDILFIYGPFER
jgi:hypothetical protein